MSRIVPQLRFRGLPTPEQIDHWTYFGALFGGSVLVLFATWVISDYAMDWIAAWWTRRSERRS